MLFDPSFEGGLGGGEKQQDQGQHHQQRGGEDFGHHDAQGVATQPELSQAKLAPRRTRTELVSTGADHQNGENKSS